MLRSLKIILILNSYTKKVQLELLTYCNDSKVSVSSLNVKYMLDACL